MASRINYLGQNIDEPGFTGSQASNDQNSILERILAALTAQHGGGPNIGAIIDRLHPPDIQGLRNRGYAPGVNNEFNPFSNGFFKSYAERKQIEKDRLGGPGILSATPAERATAIANTKARFPGMLPQVGRVVANPFDEAGGLLPGVPLDRPLAAPAFAFPQPNPTVRAIPGGVEGMINPQLQGPAKYSDANFWSAMGMKPKKKAPAYFR